MSTRLSGIVPQTERDTTRYFNEDCLLFYNYNLQLYTRRACGTLSSDYLDLLFIGSHESIQTAHYTWLSMSLGYFPRHSVRSRFPQLLVY